MSKILENTALTLVILYVIICSYGAVMGAMYPTIEERWHQSELECVERLKAKGVPPEVITRINGSCVDTRRTWNQSARMGDL